MTDVPRSSSEVPPGHAAGSGRVLVVDDQEQLRALLAEELTEAGYQVSTAPDPPTALALIAGSGFDVVVSDIVMPGMNGIQFLTRIRKHDPELPVILMTGSPTLETAIAALEHGAAEYLLKPFKAEALLASVTKALRLRRMGLLRRQAVAYLRSHGGTAQDLDSLGASLTGALQQIWMAYQPIVLASDGSLFGHEALLRSDDTSLPNPAAFLDAAERLGRIGEVGRAVRGSVAAAFSAGAVSGNVFVNVHAHDLSDESLLSPEAPLSKIARNVVIEITERAGLEGVTDARGRVRRLRDMGFRIAVDDLGAGYSGLNSFAALEPDIVKLDISLVRGVHAEPVKQKLISSMTSLCKDLGIQVVAEGIESVEDKHSVTALGCDLLQGFLLGRPSRR